MQSNSQVFDNLATADNGCVISECSSQMPKGESYKVLTSIRKDLWIASGPPPQYLVLDLTQLHHRPQSFNIFGFDCWHDYPTNPALIELLVSQDGKRYASLAKFPCERAPGWQYFKLQEISFNRARFLKVMIVNNHGGEKTYMNQVMLGFQQRSRTIEESTFERLLPSEPQKQIKQRDKVTSEHLKMTSTQKQLKRVSQRVRHLENENNFLKQKMREQAGNLVHMQNSIGMLVKNMEKMQKMIENNQRIHSSTGYGLNLPQHLNNSKFYHTYNEVPSDRKYESYALVPSQRHNAQQFPPFPHIPSDKEPQSQSSRHQPKNSTNNNNNKQPIENKKHSKARKSSQSNSSSEVSLHTSKQRCINNKDRDERYVRKHKILPLLQILQQKLTLKTKLQQKLMSPSRTQQDPSSSDQSYSNQ